MIEELASKKLFRDFMPHNIFVEVFLEYLGGDARRLDISERTASLLTDFDRVAVRLVPELVWFVFAGVMPGRCG